MYPQLPLGTAIRHRKEFVEIDDTETYKRCRVRLHAAGIVLRDEMRGSEIKTKRQQVCRSGEFLVAEIDAKLGGFGIVPEELHSAIVSSHYFLFEIDETILNRRFLDYYIRTRAFRDQVEAQGSTNYAAIRPQNVLEYLIPLPPRQEQQRIVARIEALAAKIEEARDLRRAVDEELTSLVTSLHSAWSLPQTEPLSELLVLDEIREPIVAGKEYPQVGVQGFGQGLFPKAAIESTQTTYKHFNRLYSGAVVLSQVKGWEGAIAVCPDELSGWYASPEYRTFRCVEGRAAPEYFKMLVATPWFHERLKSATRGVGARRERTRPESFLSLSLPMPDFASQQKAAKLLRNIPQLRQSYAEADAQISSLLPAILDRVFRGEL